jgi:hypothetical protein
VTVTILQPGSERGFTPGQVTIAWKVEGGRPADVLVQVLIADSDVEATSVRALEPGRLRLSTLPQRVSVTARPVEADVFPDGTVLTGQITSHTDGEPEQFVLPRIDVSGTPYVILVQLFPDTDAWHIAVPPHELPRGPRTPPGSRGVSLDEGSVGLPDPTGDLVVKAGYSARRQVGVPRLPVASQWQLRIAIDRSASFLPFMHSGAVQTLLEVLIGINGVIGNRKEVEVWDLAPSPRRLPVLLAEENVHDYADQHLQRRTLVGGSPLEPLVHDLSGSGRTMNVVLTDGAPPDLKGVTDRLRQSAEPTGAAWHMLVIGRGPDDPEVRRQPWRDELSDLRPFLAEGLLRASSVTPESGVAWLAHRLENTASLDQLVGALLVGTV